MAGIKDAYLQRSFPVNHATKWSEAHGFGQSTVKIIKHARNFISFFYYYNSIDFNWITWFTLPFPGCFTGTGQSNDCPTGKWNDCPGASEEFRENSSDWLIPNRNKIIQNTTCKNIGMFCKSSFKSGMKNSLVSWLQLLLIYSLQSTHGQHS